MEFLIASIIGILGMVILLWKTKPTVTDPAPLIDTDRWIDEGSIAIEKFVRKILRVVVFHLVSWYRFIIHDMTIHKTMKQKVRELLYEHHREQRAERQSRMMDLKSTPTEE